MQNDDDGDDVDPSTTTTTTLKTAYNELKFRCVHAAKTGDLEQVRQFCETPWIHSTEKLKKNQVFGTEQRHFTQSFGCRGVFARSKSKHR
jgi:hypothetical protein